MRNFVACHAAEEIGTGLTSAMMERNRVIPDALLEMAGLSMGLAWH